MAGFELLELELLLLDGFDELEFLPLESFELVQIVLSFFDSKEFDLHEESALEVSFFFCFTSCSSFFSSFVFAESSDDVIVVVLPFFHLSMLFCIILERIEFRYLAIARKQSDSTLYD
jgi:hypothetical protein